VLTLNSIARLVGSAVILFNVHAAAATPTPLSKAECHPRQLASINLVISRNGSVLVPVSTHQTPLYMYLEIASPLSSVTDQAAARFALPRTDIAKGLDIGMGNQRVQQYAALSFQLGDLKYSQEHILVSIDPASNPHYSNPDVIGVLGMDLLWTMDIELDLKHRKMILFQPSTCGAQVVAWSNAPYVVPLQRDAFGSFFFPMELDGKKLEATLTTNDSVSTLSTDVTQRIYGFDKNSTNIETVADADGKTSSQYRAMKLTSSGLTVIDEKIKLTDPPGHTCRLARKNDAIGYTGCFFRYPLRLGNDVLGKLHVYLATRENTMYFTVSGEAL
jgi:hypothetical protein